MKRLLINTAVLVMAFSFNGCGPGQAQNGGMSMGGNGNGSGRNMMNSGGKMTPYSRSSFMTVDVTVTKIGANESNPDGGIGLHLYTRTSSGKSYTLHVAPQFYIDEKNISYKVGEKLKASGSFFIGGASVGDSIYASSITRVNSNETMQFRDSDTGEGIWKAYMKKKMQTSMREKMRAKMKKKMQNSMEKENTKQNTSQ